MRTIVDLPDEQLAALAAVCEREGISRAEAVRRAVSAFTRDVSAAPNASAFGLWKRRKRPGLVYERRLRSEW